MKHYQYEKYNYDFLGLAKYIEVTWDSSFSDKLINYNNIDAQLTSILSESIAREIDKQILKELRNFNYEWKIEN